MIVMAGNVPAGAVFFIFLTAFDVFVNKRVGIEKDRDDDGAGEGCLQEPHCLGVVCEGKKQGATVHGD